MERTTDPNITAFRRPDHKNLSVSAAYGVVKQDRDRSIRSLFSTAGGKRLLAGRSRGRTLSGFS